MLEALKFTEFRERRAKELSGGMKRKLSVGIALVGGSKVGKFSGEEGKLQHVFSSFVATGTLKNVDIQLVVHVHIIFSALSSVLYSVLYIKVPEKIHLLFNGMCAESLQCSLCVVFFFSCVGCYSRRANIWHGPCCTSCYLGLDPAVQG